MEKNAKIYLAGHRGLVGSAIARKLAAAGYERVVSRAHSELDLTDQAAVRTFMEAERPEYVFLAAAKVGGILGNANYPADFIYQNLAIQNHVLQAAHQTGVRRLLFLGSSCIYPKHAPQPMREEYLMTGPLEPTNAPYAVAKIAGIEMCWSFNRQHETEFLPVMPTNLYGPNDNFNLETSHVLPALVRKFHLAQKVREGDWDAVRRDEARFGPIPDELKEALGIEPRKAPEEVAVVLWGTGAPCREFLFVDDLADACLFLMTHPDPSRVAPFDEFLVNIGAGEDLTIRELAEWIASVVGYDGRVVWDAAKPDGTPRKLLNVTRMRGLGWNAETPLGEGIRRTYDWYREAVGG
jgi:GDP-L-fucose synthase